MPVISQVVFEKTWLMLGGGKERCLEDLATDQKHVLGLYAFMGSHFDLAAAVGVLMGARNVPKQEEKKVKALLKRLVVRATRIADRCPRIRHRHQQPVLCVPSSGIRHQACRCVLFLWAFRRIFGWQLQLLLVPAGGRAVHP